VKDTVYSCVKNRVISRSVSLKHKIDCNYPYTDVQIIRLLDKSSSCQYLTLKGLDHEIGVC
jgi:hypothetical protein